MVVDDTNDSEAKSCWGSWRHDSTWLVGQEPFVSHDANMIIVYSNEQSCDRRASDPFQLALEKFFEGVVNASPRARLEMVPALARSTAWLRGADQSWDPPLTVKEKTTTVST